MPANGRSARSGAGGQAYIGSVYLPRLKQWSVSASVGESTWGDSDSIGYTNRKAARLDCTGSLTGVKEHAVSATASIYKILQDNRLSADNPPVLFNQPTSILGRSVQITLWEVPKQSDIHEYNWLFPSAIIQNFNVTYDMDTKEVVEWTLDFAADGLFYNPTDSRTRNPDNGPKVSFDVTTV